jgi:3-hydroxy-3-methylglutaryl CoA synthase
VNEPVGIDDLNVYGGTLSVDFSAIAAARARPARELDAVGFERRSVTPPYEDPVTLAVNAAWPLVEELGPAAFELLIVATESGLDFGKPLSSYVHRYLGLAPRCRNLEVKHACYGGTAAVQLAAAWVRSGEVPGGRALVVMTDTARRHFGDPAELTAGSGAVAVTVTARPRVLEIEPGSGYASREVYDVARPTFIDEWGDPVLSLAAYFDLVEEAWAGYQRARMDAATDAATNPATNAATSPATNPTTDPATNPGRFRYLLYHTPLEGLVRQAHSLLLEAGVTSSGNGGDGSFEQMVRPALGYARQLGNIYSGSVYCLLAGLVDGVSDLTAGTPVGVCSYGSGSCAEFYCGRIGAGARETVGRHRIGEHLAERFNVDVGQYERLVLEAERMTVMPDIEPALDAVPGHFERSYQGRRRLVLQRSRGHHRHYAWCDRP